MEPTEKQKARVQRIINAFGAEKVQKYYPAFDVRNLTKDQAQKIIQGLGHTIAKPVYGVAGRDVPW